MIEATTVTFIEFEDVLDDLDDPEKVELCEDLWDYLVNGGGLNYWGADQDEVGCFLINRDYIDKKEHGSKMRWIMTYLWDRYKHLFDDGTVHLRLDQE